MEWTLAAWDNTTDKGARWDLILKWTGENAPSDLDLSLLAQTTTVRLKLDVINCWWPCDRLLTADPPMTHIIYIILLSWQWTLEHAAIEVNVQCNNALDYRRQTTALAAHWLYDYRSVGWPAGSDDHQNVTSLHANVYVSPWLAIKGQVSSMSWNEKFNCCKEPRDALFYSVYVTNTEVCARFSSLETSVIELKL